MKQTAKQIGELARLRDENNQLRELLHEARRLIPVRFPPHAWRKAVIKILGK